MSDNFRSSSEADARPQGRFSGAMKHVRMAALAASMVPLASVAIAPVAVSAQCQSACPPVNVPEPATFWLLASSAAAAPAAVKWLRGRRK
jgi:hypothetical protein